MAKGNSSKKAANNTPHSSGVGLPAFTGHQPSPPHTCVRGLSPVGLSLFSPSLLVSFHYPGLLMLKFPVVKTFHPLHCLTVEVLVCAPYLRFLKTHSLCNPLQSACCLHCYLEITFVKVTDLLLVSTSHEHFSVPLSLQCHGHSDWFPPSALETPRSWISASLFLTASQTSLPISFPLPTPQGSMLCPVFSLFHTPFPGSG